MHNLKPLWLFLHFTSGPEPVLSQSTFCFQFFLMPLYLLPNFLTEISRLVCVPYRISFRLSSEKSLFKSAVRNSFWRALKTSLLEDFLKVTFKVWVQIYALQVQIHELRVQIHELRVQIHELRAPIHELRVPVHELRVMYHPSCVRAHLQYLFLCFCLIVSCIVCRNLTLPSFRKGAFRAQFTKMQ